MIIFINIDKIIFINTTVINRRICYMASFPTNELNNLFTTYNTKVGNRWDGRETARGCSRKLSLGLDLRFDLGMGLRLGLGLGLRQDLGLGLRLGLGLGLRQDLELGLRLGFGLGLRQDLGLGLRLGLRQDLRLGLRQDLVLGLNLDIRQGLPFDIGEWQVPRRSNLTRRAARGWKPRED
jgi:hypothetical protein